MVGLPKPEKAKEKATSKAARKNSAKDGKCQVKTIPI